MFTALRRLCNGFSPLFLPFRGSRFINGKKIHLHPYAYKKTPPLSPFLQEPYGKLGARAQKRGFAFFCRLWSDREFVSIPRTSAREPAFSICHPEPAKRPSRRTSENVNRPCHFDRGKEQQRVTEWRNLARCVSVTNSFCRVQNRYYVLYKIPPLASLGRNDRGKSQSTGAGARVAFPHPFLPPWGKLPQSDESRV